MYLPFLQVIVRNEERRILKVRPFRSRRFGGGRFILGWHTVSSAPPEARRFVRLFGRFNLVNERVCSVCFLESLFP